MNTYSTLGIVVKKLVVSVFWLCNGLISYGQSRPTPEQILEARNDMVMENHRTSFVAHVITGKKYPLEYVGAINSQFFRNIHPDIGTMTYEGIHFPDVELQYDLYSQQVVVLLDTKNNAEYVSIDEEKLTEFTLKNYKFVTTKSDSVMADGIYQKAYSNAFATFYIKRRKNIKEILTGKTMQVEFIAANDYYIKNELGTFRIRGKRSFLEAFGNSEKTVNLVKTNKIKFGKNTIEKGILRALWLMEENEGND